MLRHGASSMAGGAQPTYSVAIQQAEDAGPVTAAEQMAAQEDDPFSRMGIFLVAGGLAGAVSRTATAPVDRLKMLLQVQEGSRLSIREGMRLMSSEGSVRAYFKGNGTNVLKIAPETSIKLGLNDYLRHHIHADTDSVAPWERMLCGGISGAVGQGLVYPLDTVRTRLAVCSSSEYGSIWSTASKLWRTEGLAAFYRGLVPSMCGILPYAGVDICLFELLKDRLLDRYDGDPPHAAIVAGGMVSSSIAQFVSYPLALVRTRLQAQGVGGRLVKYSGMGDVFRQTYVNEGLRGFYKGLLPNLIKLAPAAGISWYVFEETKLLLGVDPRT